MKTPSYIVPCSLWHLVYLCENMRSDEIQQYLALTGAETFDPGVAALGMANMMATGPAFSVVVADAEGRQLPVCAGGYTPVIPGVWSSWMVGTQVGWNRSWRTITKATVWAMEFMFNEMGARRLQTNALDSRDEACWWYQKSLRMIPEGVWAKFGKNGEDVACFARTAPNPVEAQVVEG